MDEKQRKRKQQARPIRSKVTRARPQPPPPEQDMSTSSSSETSSSSTAVEIREGLASSYWVEDEVSCLGCSRSLGGDGETKMRCGNFPYSHLTCGPCFVAKSCCEVDKRRNPRKRGEDTGEGHKVGGDDDPKQMGVEHCQAPVEEKAAEERRPKLWQYFIDMV